MRSEADAPDPTGGTTDLPEGTTLLDRYRLLDQVASGGMATIHRARDTRLDRIVCVKLLRVLLRSQSASNAEVVYRLNYRQFLREARSLSKLQHPNTLRIYDFGYLDDSRPFQISEYLEGGNLEEYQRSRGTLSEEETLSIIEPITGALAEAHGLGIIHRDIKPSNILFSLAGSVKFPKLADFGIARSELCEPLGKGDEITAPDLFAPATTMTLFSPRWAAPEQLTNSPEGPFTDVYALALMVASLLSGKQLFDDARVRPTFVRRVASDAFVQERLGSLGLASEVKAVLEKALAAVVSKRTSSPTAFFDELQRAVSRPAAGGAGKRSPRRPMDSSTLASSEGAATHTMPAHGEERYEIGTRIVRVVPVEESLDVIVRWDAREVRFRVTLIPGTTRTVRAHVKGLSCFIRKVGSPPSAAITAETDGEAEFTSQTNALLGSCRWAFGVPVAEGHLLFRLADEELVLRCDRVTPALAIEISGHREVLVLAPGSQRAVSDNE